MMMTTEAMISITTRESLWVYDRLDDVEDQFTMDGDTPLINAVVVTVMLMIEDLSEVNM